MSNHILFAGLSYCAQAMVEPLRAKGWRLSATARDADKVRALSEQGIDAVLLTDDSIRDALSEVTHILLSAPPDVVTGDPLYPVLSPAIKAMPKHIKWIGYLSTTGVYGDHAGAWIDEDSPAGPMGARGQRRVEAEELWRSLGEATGCPTHFFRLPGIYGPGRNMVATVRAGKARRIIKKGQVFSRIHVDDIAQTVIASMHRPHAGRTYNVCDDLPTAPADVVLYAAELLGVAPPEAIAFEDADLSPMAQSFYAENKRLRNDRIKTELGVELQYPTYKHGLKACLDGGD